jgi:Lar family restriction alleviation protein
MSELKPCPFCGSKDIMIEESLLLVIEQHFWCTCGECLASTKEGTTEKEAINIWNTRVGELGES